MTSIAARPLTADAFRPYGDVIEAVGAADMIINAGRCGRYHDLARLTMDGGKAGISIFCSEAGSLPYDVTLMERHPIGSQAFIPMAAVPFLVVVAADDGGRPGAAAAFLTAPGQGVNYLANIWHAPLIALDANCPFAVIDRIGPGDNLQEARLATPLTVRANR